MWNAFKEGIFMILLWIQNFVGDWGLAIIVLTVLIRMLLWPLTAKQVKGTYELQKVTPEIKKIQEKYADDKEKQQEELMKFYAEHKVNPFSSCLPMILQMPIFLALYQILGPVSKKAAETMSEAALAKINLGAYLGMHDSTGSIFGFIKDLTISPSAMFKTGNYLELVPLVILVVIFGLSVWLPQALMPGEKSQKMIGLYMAVFMLFVGWSAPAGVLLYWDVSSILGIAQQQLTQNAVKRALGKDEELVEEAIDEADDKPSKKKNSKKSK